MANARFFISVVKFQTTFPKLQFIGRHASKCLLKAESPSAPPDDNLRHILHNRINFGELNRSCRMRRELWAGQFTRPNFWLRPRHSLPDDSTEIASRFSKSNCFSTDEHCRCFGQSQNLTQILSVLTLQNPAEGFATPMLIDEKTFACARC